MRSDYNKQLIIYYLDKLAYFIVHIIKLPQAFPETTGTPTYVIPFLEKSEKNIKVMK